VTNYDFGTLPLEATNKIDLLFQLSIIDFGTITQPASINLNFGTVLGT
jgi:hypothetical protein